MTSPYETAARQKKAFALFKVLSSHEIAASTAASLTDQQWAIVARVAQVRAPNSQETKDEVVRMLREWERAAVAA